MTSDHDPPPLRPGSATTRRAFLAASLSAIGGLLGAGRLSARPAPRARTIFGLCTHSLDAKAVSELRALGVSYVRYAIYWGYWAADPAYRRNVADGLARIADLHPLLVLHGPPTGATVTGFRDFALDVAARWPHADLQLWNEVDVQFSGSEALFGGATVEERARKYAAMLRVVVPPLRAASRGKIVTSGIGGEPAAWLRVLDDAPRDVDAVHCYGWPVAAAVERKLAQRGTFPVWCTEFGMDPAVLPPGFSGDWEQEQARQWQQAIDFFRRLGYPRAYGYALFTQEPQERHGIIRPDGSLRPAAAVLRAATVG